HRQQRGAAEVAEAAPAHRLAARIEAAERRVRRIEVLHVERRAGGHRDERGHATEREPHGATADGGRGFDRIGHDEPGLYSEIGWSSAATILVAGLWSPAPPGYDARVMKPRTLPRSGARRAPSPHAGGRDSSWEGALSVHPRGFGFVASAGRD